jgi:hypothetical protein
MTAKNVSAAVKTIDGEAKLLAAIKQFGERSTSLQMEAHVIACSILKHVEKHGDIRMVNTLLAAVGKENMLRMNALKEWFEKFGKIAFEKDNACYVGSAKTRLADAMAVPFWKLVKEAVYQPLNMSTYIEKQIKLLQKDIKNTPNADHAPQLALIKALNEHSKTVATTLAN